MGKFSLGKVLDSLCLSSAGSSSGCCFCINNNGGFESEVGLDEEIERRPLIGDDAPNKDDQRVLMLRDVISGPPTTLAFQLKPKRVVLRVSMHCYGCAKKVEKQISKMEGVTSYQVNLETKTVVVIGDIVPFEILEGVSKVKYAQLLSNTAYSH